MQIYIRTVAAIAADALTLVASGFRSAAHVTSDAAGALSTWSLR